MQGLRILLYCLTMADKQPENKKGKQLSLAEYAAIKEKLAKSRLKLNFPIIIKFCCILPIGYLIFLVAYYLFYLRFVAER